MISLAFTCTKLIDFFFLFCFHPGCHQQVYIYVNHAHPLKITFFKVFEVSEFVSIFVEFDTLIFFSQNPHFELAKTPVMIVVHFQHPPCLLKGGIRLSKLVRCACVSLKIKKKYPQTTQKRTEALQRYSYMHMHMQIHLCRTTNTAQ